MDDLIDRDCSESNVKMLYPTLLRPKTLGSHDISAGDGSSVFENQEDFVRPGMVTPISAKKPDYSSFRVKNKGPVRPISEFDAKAVAEEIKQTKKPSVSFNEEKQASGSRKQSVGTSFTSGSNIDTLRKSDTNTILVLSGGDGYRDWKKRQSLPNYRPEEPCLVFWMYKF